ncbi:long-chain fatty acid--CoA ligase [Streptomyces sp. YIM 98790]|uniref:AMP-dependent synthetase/ligase n=1 Tax=Streptomyces sp. YIM 98790 TaxID=2689077 RepID=UPI00140B2BC3|nr:AMP-dependent synthetase/ligase [Streptomyces sp. YIM 98790]
MSPPYRSPVPLPPLVRPELTRDHRTGRVLEAAMPALAPPVTSGSLGDIPFVNARQDPHAVALGRKDHEGVWQDVTCARFAEEVLDVARGLIAHGLEPGDRLAIISRTRYEWTLLDFAAWAAGLVTVPVYPTSSPRQIAWILRDCGARACVVEGVTEARAVSSVRGELPGLEHLWQLNAISGSERGAVGQISSAGRTLPDALVTERRALLAPYHAATLIYTSGTTGMPRGCVVTHGNFFAEVDNAIELLYPLFRSLSKEPAGTLLFLPLAHVLGRMTAVACLRARVRLGHAPSIQTDELLADLAGFGPTFLVAIPHVLEKVFNTARATAESMGRAASFDRAARVARRFGAAQEAAWHAAVPRRLDAARLPRPGLRLRAVRAVYDPLVFRRIRAALGGKVRHVICGGSPLGRRLAAFYEGAGISVYEGYGMTETTAAVTVTPPQRPRLGTVGWPLPGTAVRIAGDGEVLVRGDTLFAGYWDRGNGRVLPGAGQDGWLATGDLGELDEEGYLTLTGRKKELIITSGGKNVAPAPLEDWLRAHPLISQCLVVGDNRPYLTALITLDPDGLAHWRLATGRRHDPLEQVVRSPELLRHIERAVNEANSQVSTAESIRGFTVLTRDFTQQAGHLTPSLKLRRSAILRDFAGEVEAMYRSEEHLAGT